MFFFSEYVLLLLTAFYYFFKQKVNTIFLNKKSILAKCNVQ